MEYRGILYIKTDSARIANANITKVTLDGALDVIEAYQNLKVIADSLIDVKTKINISLKSEIGSYKQLSTINALEAKRWEKLFKKQKLTKNLTIIGGSVVIGGLGSLLIYQTLR